MFFIFIYIYFKKPADFQFQNLEIFDCVYWIMRNKWRLFFSYKFQFFQTKLIYLVYYTVIAVYCLILFCILITSLRWFPHLHLVWPLCFFIFFRFTYVPFFLSDSIVCSFCCVSKCSLQISMCFWVMLWPHFFIGIIFHVY